MTKNLLKRLVILKLLLLPFLSISQADDELFSISGVITGCSANKPVHVLLYNEAVFKDMIHIQENVYQPEKEFDCAIPYTLQVQKGSYVIAAFEDKNINQKLDFFFFIPKEPSGFFRAFTGMSAPNFEKLKFDVADNFVNADIELQ